MTRFSIRFEDNFLELNVKKIIIDFKKNKSTKTSLIINNKNVKTVEYLKYLDKIIVNNLSFTINIMEVFINQFSSQ